MKKISLFILLSVLIFSCKKEELSNGIVQIVYTSDLHYGASRNFRGAYVNASVVNEALVNQINTLPVLAFPDDAGINAGKVIGAIDYVIITGDITERQEVGPPQIQPASISWGQFASDYFDGISLTNQNHQRATFLLECGNHDVSNVIGFPRLLFPLTDAAAMVNIYNLMLTPSTPKTNSTYNYANDKINYSKDIAGVHLLFVNIWPDSAQRVWMEKDLKNVSSFTPVIIFTHDQPDCEAKHFTNPNGTHDINSTNKFENIVEERFKDADTIKVESILEQRSLVAFLKAHQNIKAYFHGNDNRNEFYIYKGPDNDISLNVFRVDSPVKGTISGIEAEDLTGDETKLSFQTIVIDGDSKTMTVRECLWNTSGSASPIIWGANSTISLK
jgi:hypothetical protein